MRVTFAILAGLTGLLLSGCPEQEAQVLYVAAVLQPDESCAVSATLGAVDILDIGILDLAVNRDGYIAAIQTVNNMVRSQEVTNLGPSEKFLENNIIAMTGATIEYEYGGSAELPSGFFQYSAYVVFPQEAAYSFINIVPPQVVQALRKDPWLTGSKPITDPLLSSCWKNKFESEPVWQEVPIGGHEVELLVRITMEGRLLGGTEVISNTLVFPIRVCNGCLAQVIGDSCFLDEAPVPDTEVTQCVVGQDRLYPPQFCTFEKFVVDASAQEWISDCVDDENWPPLEQAQNFSAPSGCSELGSYQLGVGGELDALNKLHLQYRYAYDRLDAYCNLVTEAPLYPPQPNP